MASATVEIENCLQGLSDRQIQEDVAKFVQSKGLSEHEPLFQLGALCAKDPELYLALARSEQAVRGEEYEGLTADQSQALRDEIDYIWRQPWKLYLTIIVCAIGATIQGWDQIGINAANLNWPRYLEGKEKIGDWLLGSVNACPYFAAAAVGVWLCDPLNSFWGRKGVIFFSGVFCFASVIGSAFTKTTTQLIICRILLGIGMGSKATTIPIFAGECAPARIRGTLLLQWQLWVAFGIFLGSTANLIFYSVGQNAWRFQLGSALLPAIPLMLFIYWVPESPRWYIKRNEPGDYVRAFNSMKLLRRHYLLAARDLYFIHKQIEIEKTLLVDALPSQKTTVIEAGPLTRGTGYLIRLGHLFSASPKHRRVRNATIASGIVMLAQQLCGINVMVFYSTSIFRENDFEERVALLVSWGFGLVNFIFCLPALSTIDTWGRRAWALFTIPNMAWTILATGFAFKIDDQSARIGVVTFFVFLFCAFYSPGLGPVPFTYSAEAFDLAHREVGMSLSVAINLFFVGVLTICYPPMSKGVKPTGSLAIFAAFNVVAFILVFLFVPETKTYTLEELDSIFKYPIYKHMSWQATQFMPAFLRKYILFKRNELPDLYTQSVVKREQGKSV